MNGKMKRKKLERNNLQEKLMNDKKVKKNK